MTDNDKRSIDEMARDICLKPGAPVNCRNCDVLWCKAQLYATRAYNAGYRKQRTAQWVTIAETEDGVIQRYTHRCTDCNYFYKTVCPRGDDYCHKCGAKMRGAMT
jgi:hypothetical protein